ncbi:MAG: glutamate synthase [Oscillospiraceae bacterium]|nr:glutamate synthase [Oscillospiraceae bacterium]
MSESKTQALTIDVSNMNYVELNEMVRRSEGDVELTGCLGQRFIAAGMGARNVRITGVPGNALGAYLNGARIEVCGNAQDAVGDTMNAGTIIVRGGIGDTAGYAMRGGKIYVEGNAGYRAGIHMKAYQDKLPVMVIGGCAGSFLGEYQAGGIIIVLGRGAGVNGKPIVSNFLGTGMHGGKLFLRSDCADILFPKQVTARPATPDDLQEIVPYLEEFCGIFGWALPELMEGPFTLVTPDSSNPYQQMYVPN